jgi:hypothetical protein
VVASFLSQIYLIDIFMSYLIQIDGLSGMYTNTHCWQITATFLHLQHVINNKVCVLAAAAYPTKETIKSTTVEITYEGPLLNYLTYDG